MRSATGHKAYEKHRCRQNHERWLSALLVVSAFEHSDLPIPVSTDENTVIFDSP